MVRKVHFKNQFSKKDRKYNMHKNFRVIAITPAGRKRYLEVLLRYMLRDRHIIDEWHLWLNTEFEDDLNYCKSLELENKGFVKTVPLEGQWDSNWSIAPFFKNCVEPDTIYIRFDDDICYIHKHAIRNLVDFRIYNPDYFLIFPNIANNGVISHIHQRMGKLPMTWGIMDYSATSSVGWRNEKAAMGIHQNFLERLSKNKIDELFFDQWILYFRERFSINSFAFFGKEFAKFGGKVGRDEENWLSVSHIQETKQYNCICGQSLVCHFAYHTQRRYLEERTEFLETYKKLAHEYA